MTDITVMMYFALSDVSENNSSKVLEIGKYCFNGIDGSPIVTEINKQIDLIIFKSLSGESAVLYLYKEKKFITLDIHYQQKSGQKPEWTLETIRALEKSIAKHIGDVCVKSHSMFAPIRRGPDTIWRYFVTADERVYEPDFDALLEDVDSKYQNVKIFHSKEKGCILYLDDDVMFGESDQDAYTRTLLGLPDRNNFRGKKVLILGGGDGGVIHEILQCDPEMVIMAEIDEEVIKACRKHMRSACGDSLDTYAASNKKIIIGDCLDVLHDYIQRNEKFDFIVNDLTEFPVNRAERGWGYDFETHCSQTFELSLRALKPTGKYLSRGGSLSGDDFWSQFEADCHKLNCNFKATNVFVPSFEETYRLYEVWRHGSNKTANEK